MRKQTEEYILSYIAKITKNCPFNRQFYVDYFKTMDDARFEQFIDDLDTGKQDLRVTSPNFAEIRLDTANNLAIGDELGIKFFTRLWMGANGDEPAYLTPIENFVCYLPVRSASQLLTKKISVPENNKKIDALTGQPTGESKGARLSYPELDMLAGSGMNYSVIELDKLRGGDNKGFRAMSTLISRNGYVSQKQVAPFSGKVESTYTLKSYLAGCHLEINL